MVDIEEEMEYINTDETNCFIATLNPIRYRSYYYDKETKLYYLNSRYYDPEVCRFINADDVSYLDQYSINGLNLYAYCLNNPIMMTDKNGNSWFSDLWNSVANFFKRSWNNIINSVNNIIGGIINIGKEIGKEIYNFIYSFETGLGYNLDFGTTGTHITFFVNTPDKWWKIWDYSIGVDVRIKGKGFAVAVGGQNSLTLHLGKSSYELGLNLRGQLFFKNAYIDDSGAYVFNKFSINGFEIALFALAGWAFGYSIPTFVPSFA